MTKPVIVKRATKGEPLTYTELDSNFQNLDDATITIAGDTGSVATDLNGSMTIAGGTALTSSVSGTTLTLNLDNTAVTAGSYTSANITVDAQGRITAAANGTSGSSGTVNTGAATKLAYYPSAGTTVDDTRLEYSYSSSFNNITMPSGDGFHLTSSNIYLESPGSAGQILIQAGGISLNIVGSGSNISVNKPFRCSQTAETPTIETYENATSYANNAYIDWNNFSGMIIVNRQDAGSGNVAVWICGGGTATKLGDSHGNESGTVASNGAGNGYRWTNNTGGTVTASFFVLKTRTGA